MYFGLGCIKCQGKLLREILIETYEIILIYFTLLSTAAIKKPLPLTSLTSLTSLALDNSVTDFVVTMC